MLADLFCCAAVLSIFYSFYSKSFSEKTAYISIIVGLLGGILLFPSPDFSKSILVGILFPASYFPEFITQSLLFSVIYSGNITSSFDLESKVNILLYKDV